MPASKSLPISTVITGIKHTYRVDSILCQDGQGFAYKAYTTVERDGQTVEIPVVVREQMMVRCSNRGADGITVVTPEEVAPTVESCLDSFIFSSIEREKISRQSPWVIDVIETFAANGTYYYAVEFLDGETFEEYVENMGGKLTFEQARRALSPIFDAVKTLHRFRALHTDIHPGHVRFVRRGNEKVPVLFSLYASLHFSDKGIQRWTLPMMKCKTGFAPPEQYHDIDHFAPQIDIFALASMVVYALSGKRLPDSRKVDESVIRSTLPSTLPENVVQGLLNALDPDRYRRTATITKFREDLGTFQGLRRPQASVSAVNQPQPQSCERSGSIFDRLLGIFRF